MSKTLHITIAIACSALMLACSSINVQNPEEKADSLTSDVPILFSAPDYWIGSRASDEVTGASVFIDGDEFGVFAYHNFPAGSSDWYDFMLNKNVTFDEETDTWSYEPVMYWPTKGTVSFFAYYPYVEGLDNPEAIEIDDAVTDWLWATPVTGKSSGTVSFTLHHALACIKVNVSCKEGMTASMKNINMSDSKGSIPNKGVLNLGTSDESKAGEVIVTSTVGSIAFPFEPQNLSVIPISSSIYIPAYNEIEDGQMTLDCVFNIDGKIDEEVSFSLPLASIPSFDAGKRYVYNLILDEDKTISIVSITIEDFEETELKDVVAGRKDVLIGNTYYVSTSDYLIQVANEINSGNLSRNVTLMNDIDLDGKEWTPIGNNTGYSGTFSGDGHTISNLNNCSKVETTNLYYDWLKTHGGTSTELASEDAKYECAGLIAYLNGGTIKDVNLNNVTIEHTGTYNNSDLHVAAVAAICSGTIENCHVSGNTTLSATAASNAKDAYDGRVGGITSLIYSNSSSTPIIPAGSVIACSVSGTLTERIAGNQYSIMGGIAGYVYGNGGRIIACHIDGTINMSVEGKPKKSDGTAHTGNAANIGGIVGLSEAMSTGTPTTTLIASYLNVSEQSTVTILGNETIYNAMNKAAISAILQMNKTTTSGNIIEDVIRSCYWTKTDDLQYAYIRPTAQEETTNGSTFGAKNQMVDISTSNWAAATAAMNASLNDYSVVECNWRYELQNGTAPILVPKK